MKKFMDTYDHIEKARIEAESIEKAKNQVKQVLIAAGIPEEEHHMYEIRNSDMLGMYIEKVNKATEWKPRASLKVLKEKMGIENNGKLYIDDELVTYAKADVEATEKFMQNMADPRYNEPKEAPKADAELVDETIVATEIYRRARLAILQNTTLSVETRNIISQAQAKQVAYGIDKYPEPLNPNTWTASETVDHILDESIDKLHYLVMLRIKIEQDLISGAYNDIVEVRNANSRIATISRMIDNNIEEMGYLIKMRILMDRESYAASNDTLVVDGGMKIEYNHIPLESLSIYSPSKTMSDIGVRLMGADMDGDKCVKEEKK